MIYGVGIDLVDVTRIEKILKSKASINFIKKIAHSQELKIKNKKNNAFFWASRFAAKEAMSKAMGSGIGKDISFKDFGVINEKNGKPKAILSVKLDRKLKKLSIQKVHISISHERTHAIAIVILERK